MPEYKTELYEDVNNQHYTFHKLFVNGVCHFDKFLQEIQNNVADKKLFNYIINYMDCISDQIRLPSTKFNHIEDKHRSDLYEFKKDRLRVYVIKQKPNFFIVIGGFKGTQKRILTN